ncbi:hypothetical protein G6O67_003118 [Ophiocordyceps sinensis]|uniref:Apple domain-containing protein n=1 Tax=Ophiocordyceps sinensis TaxID=72228 RepID=A0A8H4V897_9HYPO|nr:hypothetical protein G6O67_003118 [Ophiocordyceps sinensis]
MALRRWGVPPGTGDASPGDGNSATLDECQTGLDDCTRSETRLQDELNACRASQGNAQEEASLRQELDTCENSRLSLQNQLRSCEASNDSLMTVVAVCPAKDGQSLRQGKGTFKFNCKSKRTGQAHKTTGHGFEMCLQACVKDAQCKATNYWWSKPASQRCEMLTGQVGYTGSTAEEHVVGAMVLTRH